MDTQAKNATADTWRERIAAQQAGGQSIRVWCRENGCHEHAFYWWRAKLGLSPAARRPRRRAGSVKPMHFAKIIVRPTTSGKSPAMSSAEPIRLSLIGGRELILPASMPVEQIARLLRAIEGVA